MRFGSKECTYENRFIALSRLSKVAIASACGVSDIMAAKLLSPTYDMIVVLLYTEFDSRSRIGVL